MPGVVEPQPVAPVCRSYQPSNLHLLHPGGRNQQARGVPAAPAGAATLRAAIGTPNFQTGAQAIRRPKVGEHVSGQPKAAADEGAGRLSCLKTTGFRQTIAHRREGKKRTNGCLGATVAATLDATEQGGIPVRTTAFEEGGYRYAEGVFQYSAGVAALDGYEIIRVRFLRPIPLGEGIRLIENHLKDAGRPLTAFCACELRSPAPFTEAGFRGFNEHYVVALKRWGIVVDERNPVARSNVCPEIDAPPEPAFHAFSYTRPATTLRPSFVIAGSGEVPEGQASYRDHIVRRGDASAAGLAEKADFVLAAMEARLAALGARWSDTTATQVYTVHDIHPLLPEIVRRAAARAGIVWHLARPPMVELDYEMDCRGVAVETVIQ